ncbi:OFA family MFS transporter [Amnibacterium endophyticum]|uniref:OFA family MFS transporter n=1 Tax=Amnibacterium endophyticum TaxID=2109337 RepID=A0ABW4LFD6_9MICO
MSAGLLTRERITAPPGWNRWLVPPAALAIHLSIGAVYAWSVFKSPLADTYGVSGVVTALPFTLGIVVLGIAAAVFGTAVDARGPRWAMTVSLVCYVGGLLVSALGAATSQVWLIVLGYGVLGGIGLGIGYISPVSTLMKWFPDKPGMATGFAIMGFGGGALIASPWTNQLFTWFGTGPGGLTATFAMLALTYTVLMALGVVLVRVPSPEWRPPTRVARAETRERAPGPDRTANQAIRTPQFWLLWVVLAFNVTAGIGILERAAPIFSDFFPDASSAAALTAAAAGFVAILSLANSAGRIAWSSLSDVLGRKNMYRIYLGVGALLYLVIVLMQNTSKPVFLIATILVLSFYGAGFATAPAYLRDLFGTAQVGAIHGRLLTAWSFAGVLGPVLVNAIADAQIANGSDGPARYVPSFIVMIVLLAIGFGCNELIRVPSAPQQARRTAAEKEEVR